MPNYIFGKDYHVNQENPTQNCQKTCPVDKLTNWSTKAAVLILPKPVNLALHS